MLSSLKLSKKGLTLLVLLRIKSFRGENTLIYSHMMLIFAIFNAAENLPVELNLMF